MKRFAFVSLLLLSLLALPVSAPAGNPWTGTAVITIATDNTTSAAVSLPKNVSRIGIQVPTIDTATLKLKVSVDGSTYQDLYCWESATGVSQLWTTASGTGGTNHVVPGEMYLWKYLKVVTSAGQTANRTFTIYGVDQPPVAVR